MKDRLDEHDQTKKMIDIMRGGYKQTKLITENEHEADTISPQPSDTAFAEELKKLQDTVDSSVNITNFKIYPIDKNVIIEGTFLARGSDDSGIVFKMSLSAREVETSMNNIDLDDDISGLLQRLKGYYKNWCEEWNLKLSNEYRPKKN